MPVGRGTVTGRPSSTGQEPRAPANATGKEFRTFWRIVGGRRRGQWAESRALSTPPRGSSAIARSASRGRRMWRHEHRRRPRVPTLLHAPLPEVVSLVVVEPTHHDRGVDRQRRAECRRDRDLGRTLQATARYTDAFRLRRRRSSCGSIDASGVGRPVYPPDLVAFAAQAREVVSTRRPMGQGRAGPARSHPRIVDRRCDGRADHVRSEPALSPGGLGRRPTGVVGRERRVHDEVDVFLEQVPPHHQLARRVRVSAPRSRCDRQHAVRTAIPPTAAGYRGSRA